MTTEMKKPKVLLVDDELSFLDAMAKALRRRGLDVITVNNGQLLLSMLDRVSADVAVLDVKMPDISGYELFEKLKERCPGIQVIFLTGHGTTRKAFEMTKKGAFGYLAKPCEVEDLTEMIHSAYRTGKGVSDSPDRLIGTEEDVSIDVLLIDDEKAFLGSVRKVLQRRNMQVSIAEDGQEGIEAVRRGTIDVVILDIKMPGMGGMEVLSRIKEEKPLVEVILLTGHASVSNAVEGLKKGAFDYLLKPEGIDELVQKIRQAAAKKQEAEAAKRSQMVKSFIDGNPT